ncbi:oligosaccharide flippase family protein [Flavobacterium sp. FlaQc-30]|uniref:oligosaccharide flippase family protein n=1 Tax=Flavobacterium sp. FlaQc-30 TaxID=3374179 RepID=UPI003756B765
MKKLISKITNRSDFFNSVLVVMSGTAISQLIAMAAMPFLSRNYTPSDFGLLTTFISVFTIIGTFINGKYERVILLARNNQELNNSSILCFLISILVSFLTFIVVLLGQNIFLDYYSISQEFYNWFYLLPVVLLVYGFNVTILSYLNYKEDYKTISTSRVVKTLTSTIFSVLGIYFMKNFGGLILGELIGYFISTLIIGNKIKGIYNFNLYSFSEVKKLAIKYKTFPVYNIPSDLFNAISSQMPSFFLIAFFGANVTGQYALMKKIIDAPISLFSSSILEVFRQKAAEQYIKFGTCKELFIKTAKNLTIISGPPFLVLFIFGPQLFVFFFGEEWFMAGVYARIFSIFYFFKFISSPLSYMFYIAGKSKLDFVLHLYIFISSLFIFYIPKWISVSVDTVLWIYSLNFIVIYLFYFVYSYKFTINDNFDYEKMHLENN